MMKSHHNLVQCDYARYLTRCCHNCHKAVNARTVHANRFAICGNIYFPRPSESLQESGYPHIRLYVSTSSKHAVPSSAPNSCVRLTVQGLTSRCQVLGHTCRDSISSISCCPASAYSGSIPILPPPSDDSALVIPARQQGNPNRILSKTDMEVRGNSQCVSSDFTTLVLRRGAT